MSKDIGKASCLEIISCEEFEDMEDKINFKQYQGKKVRLHLENGDVVTGEIRTTESNGIFHLYNGCFCLSIDRFTNGWEINRVEVIKQPIDLSKWNKGDVLVSRGGIVITKCHLNEEDYTKAKRPYKVGNAWLVTKEGRTQPGGKDSKFDIIAHITGNDAKTIHDIIKKAVS